MPFYRLIKIVTGAALLAALALLLYSRILYSHILFERDEGEYAHAGQLILNGLKPYHEAYNMKFPGTYAMYALFMGIGGQTPEAVHWGTLIMLCITAMFIFLTVRLITNNASASLVSVVVFFALNSTMSGEGLMSNAEHFVNVFAAAGLYFLFAFDVSKKTRQLLLAGFFSGCAIIMKQHGYVFVLFGLLFLGLQWVKDFSPQAFKRIFIYGLSAVSPLLILLFIVILNGTFHKFFFLTFSYARAYVGMYPASFNEFRGAAHTVAAGSRHIWWIAEASIIALLLLSKKRYALLLVLLCVLCTVAIGTGGYYRFHYYILYYVAFGVVSGVALAYLQRVGMLTAAAAWFSCLLFMVLFFANYKDKILSKDPISEFRLHYHWSPFYDAPAFCDTLNTLMKPGQRLTALSNEPELYFFSKRVSATPYIYDYALFENQPYAELMLNEYLQDVEHERPDVFVYSTIAFDVRNNTTFNKFKDWWLNYRKAFKLEKAYCITGPVSSEYYDYNRLQKDSTWVQYGRMEIWVRKSNSF
ncbi:MAG: glycosyltransferase family 39 protein [Chitinophagales bacterium]